MHHLSEFVQTSTHLQIASHMFISSLEGLVSHTFLRCMLELSMQVKWTELKAGGGGGGASWHLPMLLYLTAGWGSAKFQVFWRLDSHQNGWLLRDCASHGSYWLKVAILHICIMQIPPSDFKPFNASTFYNSSQLSGVYHLWCGLLSLSWKLPWVFNQEQRCTHTHG